MQFIKESIIRAAPEQVFAFHELPDAMERLIPPWEKIHILQKADISKIGSRAVVEQKLFRVIPLRWVAEHTRYEPPYMFEDVLVSGPFAIWRHRHRIIPHREGAILRDEIEYEPPFWLIGRLAAPLVIAPKLQKLFAFRHEVTRGWAEQG